MVISEKLKKLFENDVDGLFNPKQKPSAPTADDRLVESFKEIEFFIEQNDRLPDIESPELNESLLAKRLESIRFNPEKVSKLELIDRFGVLKVPETPKTIDELFANDSFDIFNSVGNEILKVKNLPKKTLSAPASVERRKPAKNFDEFKSGFLEMQQGLAIGKYKLKRFRSSEQLQVGKYYVSLGMMVYVAGKGETKTISGSKKARLRCIFENGTESSIYDRSLAIDLYEDGYLVVDSGHVDASQMLLEEDTVRGYIYVLSSKSSDPKITTIKDLYKIGYSTTPILDRIKKAEKDPTYLMAEVELVDSYIITNDYNPQKIEYFLHRIFSEAAIDLEIIDKNGRKYKPLEWYSVPLPVINQAINLLQSGEITDYAFDLRSQKLVFIND